MARKIRVKLGEFRLSNVEIEIEDTEDDATAAVSAVQDRLVSAMPTAMVQALSGPSNSQAIPVASQSVPNSVSSRNGTPRKRAGSSVGKQATESPAMSIAYVHQPEKYGVPVKTWNTATKAMYLLWVFEEIAQVKELSAGDIAALFGKFFSQFNGIQPFNVTRDLGTLRTNKSTFVTVDNNKTPAVWSLLEGGKAYLKNLLAQSQKAT